MSAVSVGGALLTAHPDRWPKQGIDAGRDVEIGDRGVMAFSSVRRSISDGHRHKKSSNHSRPRRYLGGIACACVALTCAWIVWANPHGTVTGQPADDLPSPTVAVRPHVTPASVANAYAKLAAAMRGYTKQSVKPDALLVLLDPHFLTGTSPAKFSENALAGAHGVTVGLGRFATGLERGISSTVSRAHRLAQNAASTLPTTGSIRRLTASVHDRLAAEKPTIFDRLFGKPAASVTLAYAAPEAAWMSDRALEAAAMIVKPPSMTSQRTPSTCPMERY